MKQAVRTQHNFGTLMIRNKILTGIVPLVLAIFAHPAYSQDFRLLFGLRGDWKFELGDDQEWAGPAFNDGKWETIHAPAKWEDEGFPGYDGYAWYRKHFRAEADWGNKSLYLRLGRIDDVDQVYVNGKFVGSSGSFPPFFETAYHVEREYYLPVACLNIPGDNVIAVRVYDDFLGGGIYEGRIGVYEEVNGLLPEIPLAGKWKFMKGDDASWKAARFDDGKWPQISVPGYWEPQGYAGYDGFAWYRLRFNVPRGTADKRMVLLLGMIDDFDETYLNGTLVGKTGTMGDIALNSNAWKELRAYTILPGTLIDDGENVLAVRVFDGFREGGIYRGPVGIISREKYMKWKDTQKRRWFDWIFR